jgi:two-component system sensor histidine kinase AgrC
MNNDKITNITDEKGLYMRKHVDFNKIGRLFESKTKIRLKKCIYKLHKNNQLLRRENDSVRAFRHDFNNMMQVMGAYIKTDNMPMLKEYYNKLMEECYENKSLECFRKIVKENPAIYSLISNKYELAHNKNIKMNIEIMCNLRNIKNDIYEITRILGILMDNAIEAANECKNEKEIYLQILKDQKNDEHKIIIENTYTNKDINLKAIYKKNYSTKEKNSGLGLWKVKKIVSKNKNLNLKTFKGEMYFKQTLTIKEQAT